MNKKTLHCAIYTRKSSEEGLEQGFNSLDAQREACEAYIQSQQQEGWKALPALYDDGGYSGGNMDRPALKQLLSDIDQQQVNVVVVYKVDRLTRSLTDFAKIVELFDAKGISFVSVTQQFNTTSSMGRLTLNVLLSFAQFEREVTGERIRDKIAASKQKGLWMGGTAPLGYIGLERSLAVVDEEAALVRGLYERYLVLGSIRALKIELDTQDIVAPVRYRKSGKAYGGRPFSRGNLHRILSNPVYIGKMTHFKQTYTGKHSAIIEQKLWDEVQALLAQNKQSFYQRPRVRSDSLLTGLLYDAEGQRLSPSHSQKKTKRFRYYISQVLVNNKQSQSPQGMRIPAQELETLVINHLHNWLADQPAILSAINPAPSEIETVLDKAHRIRADLNDQPNTQYETIRALVSKVVVSEDAIQLSLDISSLLASESDSDSSQNNQIHFTIKTKLKRCGYAMRLIVMGDNEKQACRDENLIRHIAKAHQWLALLTSGKVASIKALAMRENVDATHVTRTLHRAFLAPDIVRAILNGSQPEHFNLKFLKQFRALPTDWNEQRELLGFRAK